MIWDRLTALQKEMAASLDLAPLSRRTKEPGMAKFNKDGWMNQTWEFEGARRAHMDVVDARETKGLWMMHVCVMPEFTNDSPIYGFDVIAGKNKITGAFLDYSPTVNNEHPLYEVFSSMTGDLQWERERNLPEWAKAIFSDNMVAAGNINGEMEVEQIVSAAKHTLWYYMDNLKYYRGNADERLGASAQNHYAKHQKMNPHTPRVMKSLGLPEADVDLFVSECLFPETSMEQFNA